MPRIVHSFTIHLWTIFHIYYWVHLKKIYIYLHEQTIFSLFCYLFFHKTRLQGCQWTHNVSITFYVITVNVHCQVSVLLNTKITNLPQRAVQHKKPSFLIFSNQTKENTQPGGIYNNTMNVCYNDTSLLRSNVIHLLNVKINHFWSSHIQLILPYNHYTYIVGSVGWLSNVIFQSQTKIIFFILNLKNYILV